MKAVILAAGFATRLYPLTLNRPKPLLDVAGEPMLTRLLACVRGIDGLDEVVVVSNERFHDQFELWAAGIDLGLPLRLLNNGADSNDNRRGAVADMALGIESIADQEAPLFVAGGDNLIDFELAPFARRFGDSSRPMLLVREVDEPVPPGRYSEVSVGDDGTLSSFREKPADPQTNLSAPCLYFLPGSIRGELARYAAENHNLDAPGFFLEWLHGRVTMDAAPITGSFFDIGNRETLELARAAFAKDPGATTHG